MKPDELKNKASAVFVKCSQIINSAKNFAAKNANNSVVHLRLEQKQQRGVMTSAHRLSTSIPGSIVACEYLLSTPQFIWQFCKNALINLNIIASVICPHLI